MKTLIKILITILFIFTLAAFAYAAWCAYNCFFIGDITLSLFHATIAVVDLFLFIRSILLFIK
jgi:hypothetical protein